MDNLLVERVDRLAAREHTTRSAIVRRLLLDLLKEDETARAAVRIAA
jgi:metal-responsive CopG/Arc/MetJ family transcriptional regulator